MSKFANKHISKLNKIITSISYCVTVLICTQLTIERLHLNEYLLLFYVYSEK